jgi:flagellar basal-body rod protein FlgG
MKAMLLNQDVIANNIANANSVGFKEDFSVIQSFPAQQIVREESPSANSATVLGPVGQSSAGSLVGQVFTDFSSGPLKETGSATDLALSGDGYFQVKNGTNVMYTRAGNFKVDDQGRLTTQDGYLVSGTDGNPLNVGSGTMKIASDGSINVDGQARGKVGVFTFASQSQLVKMGNGMFASATNPTALVGAKVVQGSLESSNVDVIKQMVAMMECFRAYQSGQQMIRAQDATLDKAVNQVGKL